MRVVAGARLEVEQADARHLVAVLADVAVAEQLVAAAHGEHGARRPRRRACSAARWRCRSSATSSWSRSWPPPMQVEVGRVRGRAARRRAAAAPRARCPRHSQRGGGSPARCRGRRRSRGARGRAGRARASRRRLLPVGPREPAARGHALQLEHRRVGRQHVAACRRRRARRGGRAPARRRARPRSPPASTPAYLSRSAASPARVPDATTWRRRGATSSQSTSQIQETSRAVGDAVVEREQQRGVAVAAGCAAPRWRRRGS